MLIGVIKSKPNFFPTSRNVCRLNEENLPDHGTIAPSRIDFVLSGIRRSKSNSIFTPRPWHVLHAPKGELNEKVLGSSSPTVIPQNGHALFCEKTRSWPSSTITVPFPAFSAVWIDSKRRLFSSQEAFSLSTTISILCHFCLSSAGTWPFSSITSPSIRILEYPDFFICSNNFS